MKNRTFIYFKYMLNSIGSKLSILQHCWIDPQITSSTELVNFPIRKCIFQLKKTIKRLTILCY